MANIDVSADWFNQQYDLQLTYDLISTLLLFFVIFLFNYFNTRSKKLNVRKGKVENLDLFVKRKKTIALFSTSIIDIFSSF